MVVVAGLSLLVGLVLGLLGGGGSILSVPALAYGAGLAPREAIATSLVVVGITAAVATVGHARAHAVRWRSGLLFGSLGMAGAFAGGRLAGLLPGRWLLLAFAAVLLVAGVLLLRRGQARAPGAAATASPLRLAATGLGVGSITGLVGAGGGFAIVPALVLLGGLGMHEAIGTSLFVIALQSAAGIAGHLADVRLDPALAVAAGGAAIAGSFLGTRLARRLDPGVLRRAFASLVLGMAVWMAGTELSTLAGGHHRRWPVLVAAGLAAAAPLFRPLLRRPSRASPGSGPVLDSEVSR